MAKWNALDADITVPPNHLQIEVVLSRRIIITPQKWRYELQSPFWRLYVHSRSGASVLYNQNRFELEPNSIHLIPAWTRFLSLTTCSITQDYLHFYVTGIRPDLLRQIFDRPFSLSSDELLAKLCEHWQKGLNREPGLVDLCWASSLADAAMAVALRDLPPSAKEACLRSGRESTTIRPAFKCIDSRLSEPPSNSELAHLCRMSTDHFGRQFRLIVGMTPAQYGLERRISAAAQWLASGSRSVEDIAAATGFTDRFHFSRIFKARMSVPPAAYRRLHQIAKGETLS